MAKKDVKATVKATEEKVLSKAADVKEAVKDTTANVTEVAKDAKSAVVEEAKTAKESVAEAAKDAKEATAKKTAAAKKTVKTVAAKAAAKSAAPKTTTIVQYQNQEVDTATVEEKVKAQFIAEGHKASSIKTLNIYVKPEEYSAYYVVNEKFSGRVDLF